MATSRIQHSTKTTDYKTIKVEKMNHTIKIEDFIGEIAHVTIALSSGFGGKKLIACITIEPDKIEQTVHFEVWHKKALVEKYKIIKCAIDCYNRF